MSFSANKIFKFICRLYIYSASFVVSIFAIIWLSTIYVADRYEDISIPNGFKYIKGGSTEGGSFIVGKDSNNLIYGRIDSRNIEWQDSFVYGVRQGIGENEYYFFLCKYGDNCIKQQNYNRKEFENLRQKYKLHEIKSSMY